MGNWYNAKISYFKDVETGVKKVTEQYLFDAVSLTDAEARVYQEFSTEMADGKFFKIQGISEMKLHDIVNVDDAGNWDNNKIGNWYKAVIVYDVDSKKISQTILLKQEEMAYCIPAIKALNEGTTLNFEIVSISKSKILDVYPFIPTVEEEQNQVVFTPQIR